MRQEYKDYIETLSDRDIKYLITKNKETMERMQNKYTTERCTKKIKYIQSVLDKRSMID